VTTLNPAGSVRVASDADVERLVELMTTHAAFERSPLDATDLSARLRATLISGARATCLVATTHTRAIVGYATYAPEFATWSAREYIHMDTLFVEESHRGHGIGKLLVDAVIDRAASEGFSDVQWQTPDWNVDAIRFYERLGATHSTKARFSYRVESVSPKRTHLDDTDLGARRR
jgi:GNAT superfamily N-acetyltransferase